MLYREIIAVCSQIHTKHINTLCGQNVQLLNVKLAVHIVTTGLWRANSVNYRQRLHPFALSHRKSTQFITSRFTHLPTLPAITLPLCFLRDLPKPTVIMNFNFTQFLITSC